MIRKLFSTLDRKERELRKSFGHDITDPNERKKSYWHVRWLDHGVLRTFWHNFEKVSDGVYRSNHPDHRRFQAYADMGVKTILNLRGVAKQPHYLFEEESCARLGLKLVTVGMSARQAPKAKQLIAEGHELLSRYYSLPVEAARQQLSFRYLHIRRSSTGVLDHFLDVYAARNAQSPIAIADWIRTEYDRSAVTASFAAKQAALKPWQGWR